MAVGELLGKPDEMLGGGGGGNPRWTASIPSRSSSNTLRSTEISSGGVGHVARVETLPFLGKLETSQCFNL